MFITTRDTTRLYAKEWGSGRPVILLHPWPLSADCWDAVAMPIAEAGYRVIAYDRRGFGRSDQPWHGYAYDTLADDLADVIDATNATDATIVGFSMGGGEVIRYMSRHAGRHVVQAVLIGSIVPYMLQTADNPLGIPRADFERVARRLNHDRAHFLTLFFKDFYGGSDPRVRVSDELVRWSARVAMQASLPATLACLWAFATTDFRPELRSCDVPTLIVHGTGDRAVPLKVSAHEAARGIARATLIEYDGAPHGMFATHTDRLVADLLGFLHTYQG